MTKQACFFLYSCFSDLIFLKTNFHIDSCFLIDFNFADLKRLAIKLNITQNTRSAFANIIINPKAR